MFDRVVGAFVFLEVLKDVSRARALFYALKDRGVNSVMTESEAYDAAAVQATHDLGLRFYAGVACFSDHGSNFAKLARRPELWPILETGERRPQMEWYIGVSPTDRTHQQGILGAIASIAATFPVD